MLFKPKTGDLAPKRANEFLPRKFNSQKLVQGFHLVQHPTQRICQVTWRQLFNGLDPQDQGIQL